MQALTGCPDELLFIIITVIFLAHRMEGKLISTLTLLEYVVAILGEVVCSPFPCHLISSSVTLSVSAESGHD